MRVREVKAVEGIRAVNVKGARACACARWLREQGAAAEEHGASQSPLRGAPVRGHVFGGCDKRARAWGQLHLFPGSPAARSHRGSTSRRILCVCACVCACVCVCVRACVRARVRGGTMLSGATDVLAGASTENVRYRCGSAKCTDSPPHVTRATARHPLPERRRRPNVNTVSRGCDCPFDAHPNARTAANGVTARLCTTRSMLLGHRVSLLRRFARAGAVGALWTFGSSTTNADAAR